LQEENDIVHSLLNARISLLIWGWWRQKK